MGVRNFETIDVFPCNCNYKCRQLKSMNLTCGVQSTANLRTLKFAVLKSFLLRSESSELSREQEMDIVYQIFYMLQTQLRRKISYLALAI